MGALFYSGLWGMSWGVLVNVCLPESERGRAHEMVLSPHHNWMDLKVAALQPVHLDYIPGILMNNKHTSLGVSDS